MPHSAAIRPSRLFLIGVDDLYRLYLGRAGDSARGKVGRERSEHVLAAPERRRYFARDVLHMTELFDAHEVFHAYASEFRKLADVIAMQVDKHGVLGALFGVAQKLTR